MIITVSLSEKEIDLLDSCVGVTENEGYDVTDEKKAIAKIREADQKSLITRRRGWRARFGNWLVSLGNHIVQSG